MSTKNENQNIMSDVASLAKIPEKIMDEIVSREVLCIGSAIREAIEAKEQELILNVGIGDLSIDLENMQCKFIPSHELKTTIKKSIKNKTNPLVEALEQSVIEKLTRAFHESL